MGRVSGVKVASGFGAAGVVLTVLALDLFLTRGWALFLFFGVVCAGACYEAAKILRRRHNISYAIVIIGGLLFFSLSAPPFDFPLFISAFPWLISALLVGAFLVTITSYEESDAVSTAYIFMLPVYVGGGLAFLSFLNRSTGGYDPTLPILFIFVVKTNDILGYLLGASFGRRKFHPVSPGKTVEGSLFGLVGGVVVAFLTHTLFSITLSPVLVLLFSVVCGVLGQMGDLGESFLKRYAGVKDSANLIPGSGGMLDFCDCFLLASPAAFAILWKAHPL